MKYLRLLIILLVELMVSVLLHILQFNWIMSESSFFPVVTLQTASDVLFVVGIVFFLPSLVAATGAFSVFYGIRYAFGILFSTRFRERHPKYRDYVSTKDTEIKTTFFIELLIASGIILLAGIILAVLVV